MNAIPTLYRGIQFRSRLEATWAAFFDLRSEPWEYEPLDLSGYIPDFVMHDGKLLVEVKPEFTYAGLLEHVGKIEQSGWIGKALIVGTHPLLSPAGHNRVTLGLVTHGAPWIWHADYPIDRTDTERTFAAAKNVVQWQSGTRADARDARTILSEAGV